MAVCAVGAFVVIDQAGKLRFRYTWHFSKSKHNLFIPRGITTNSQSQILAADGNNHCIHILDHEGEFLCYIENLNEPVGLCVDKQDNIFVAEYKTEDVKGHKIPQWKDCTSINVHVVLIIIHLCEIIKCTLFSFVLDQFFLLYTLCIENIRLLYYNIIKLFFALNSFCSNS